ncbi:hypothetical protein A3768_5649 (plasmid) [Ralstonia solanacearum]|nr:hypothetical protein A3768_5649 [Ralstonia solanacearum]
MLIGGILQGRPTHLCKAEAVTSPPSIWSCKERQFVRAAICDNF